MYQFKDKLFLTEWEKINKVILCPKCAKECYSTNKKVVSCSCGFKVEINKIDTSSFPIDILFKYLPENYNKIPPSNIMASLSLIQSAEQLAAKDPNLRKIASQLGVISYKLKKFLK